MASHDDETPQMRARYAAMGVGICEFPLDLETAASAKEAGQEVILGGPNVVRGKSHTRRLSARAALEAGLGTVLTSDYYYPSMVQAAFRLVRDGVMELAQAWDLVAGRAARAAGLHDRGVIREGLRADLVVIDDSDAALPMVAATVVRGRLAHLADPELWTGHGV
jgi:alpha-D-ribose 1-methylphosphonate 5-triphosphate diphosphatase